MTQVNSDQDMLVPLGSSARNQWAVSTSKVNLVRESRPARPLSVPATPQTLTFDLAASAIVIIDMQNDFCHADGWLASIGVDIAPARSPIEPLVDVLPVLRAQDMPVIWLNWGNRPDLLNCSPTILHVYDPDGRSHGLGAQMDRGSKDIRVLEEGSWSAAVVDELMPVEGDIQVSKYRMSGFWDTPLDSILRNLKVQTLLFAGVNLDQCVLATLIDASCAGYDCILLEDCAATTSPSFCTEATLYNVRQCFGLVAKARDIRSAIEDAAA
ncbi:MAG: isochorismatase family cysteine hydrolase [Novosphingobium sp.]